MYVAAMLQRRCSDGNMAVAPTNMHSITANLDQQQARPWTRTDMRTEAEAFCHAMAHALRYLEHGAAAVAGRVEEGRAGTQVVGDGARKGRRGS